MMHASLLSSIDTILLLNRLCHQNTNVLLHIGNASGSFIKRSVSIRDLFSHTQNLITLRSSKLHADFMQFLWV